MHCEYEDKEVQKKYAKNSMSVKYWSLVPSSEKKLKL
jgi:hypothetical protein